MLDLEVDFGVMMLLARANHCLTGPRTCIHLAGGRMTSMFDSATYTSGPLSKIKEYSYFFFSTIDLLLLLLLLFQNDLVWYLMLRARRRLHRCWYAYIMNEHS